MNTFTGVMIAPSTVNMPPGRTYEDFIIMSAIRELGEGCTLSLSKLKEALDAGYETFAIQISIDGKTLFQLKVEP